VAQLEPILWGRASPLAVGYDWIGMDLDELRAFVAVVETGSFAAAAKRLRFARATLHRRIDELEVRVGVPLLRRARDGAVATEAGGLLAARARELLADAQAVMESVRAAGADPLGEIRLIVPIGLPPQALIHVFQLLRGLFPRISWNIRCVEDPAAELAGEVDVALHIGASPPANPSKVVKLLSLEQRLIASRPYLAKHGTPRAVTDLAEHDLLVWQGPGADVQALPLAGGTSTPIAPALVTQDIFLLRQMAIFGSGIAFLPEAAVPNPITDESSLVRVLPDLVRVELGLWIVAPALMSDAPRIGAVIEQMARLAAAFLSRAE
jgi:DNA-binding transcriptional LysR family regulator